MNTMHEQVLYDCKHTCEKLESPPITRPRRNRKMEPQNHMVMIHDTTPNCP
eukprot:m.14403 g.14403  ORF g.14403 m.14403 type:complete len:51 (-) comp7724_c0_seq1:600-752(-)